MIRVLHSVSNMDRAGLETMLMNYYRHIDREQIQFDFLANKPKPGAYEEEVRSMGGRIFVSPGFHPARLLQYQKYMKELFTSHPEIQIVHAHNGALAYYALREAQKNQIPYRIAHSHNSKINFDFKWPIKQYCKAHLKKAATDYWGCGELAVRFYFGEKVAKEGNYTIIRNAIEEERFLFRSDIRAELRRKYQVGEKFVVGHVGRFMYQKNHTFLLDIFAKIKERRPDSVLLLIGEGELEDAIRQKAERLGIQESILFTGSIPNVNEMYQMMDVFLLPSLYEGLPVVGIEAQASDVRCVFSDTITREVQISERTEFIPLTASAEQWADQILSKDCKYERKDRTADLVKAGYSIHTEAKKLQDLYLNMINRSENGK